MKIFAAEEFQQAGTESSLRQKSHLPRVTSWCNECRQKRSWNPPLGYRISRYCSLNPRDLAGNVQLSQSLLILFVALPLMRERLCHSRSLFFFSPLFLFTLLSLSLSYLQSTPPPFPSYTHTSQESFIKELRRLFWLSVLTPMETYALFCHVFIYIYLLYLFYNLFIFLFIPLGKFH